MIMWAWNKCLLAILPLSVISFSGCTSAAYDYKTVEGAAWHTSYRVVYQGDDALADSIISVFPIVENSLSPFVPNSLISLINANVDSVADAMIATVFKESRKVCGISGGAFDPTVSPLINLWGFGFGNRGKEEPSQAAIDSALAFVGILKASIDEDNVIRKPDPRMHFNFSAITKGYGCDLVAEMLDRNGVVNYMIEIGGEIVTAGSNRYGKPWRIQIDLPDEDNPSAHSRLRVVSIQDCAIATSGNYRNYRDIKGVGRVGHTISPHTGRPVCTSVLSVSVMAPTCLLADALATAAMSMQPDSAMRMLNGMADVEAMFVIADTVGDGLKILYTDSFPTE